MCLPRTAAVSGPTKDWADGNGSRRWSHRRWRGKASGGGLRACVRSSAASGTDGIALELLCDHYRGVDDLRSANAHLAPIALRLQQRRTTVTA